MQLYPARIIWLIAAVKFVYILDFMMLMPLGPDIAQALSFPAEHLGWLSAVYTLASMLAGLLAIGRLDRFDRKPAFLLFFGVMLLTTLATAFAPNLDWLFALRALTGLAGSPAVALAMAIIIDTTAPAQRGQVIGKVMIGFSLAAVLGIPLALELARLGDWRTPFLAVAALATLVWLAASIGLPSLTGHRHSAGESRVTPWSLLRQAAVRKACLIQASSQFAAFLVVPHFSAFFLLNLNFPREWLGSLYLAGGLCAMAMMQLLGRITDRHSPVTAVTIACGCTLIGLTPLLGLNGLPLILPFVLFMAGNAGRNVSLAAVTSQVPAAHERASYVALEGIVQDLSISLAAMTASLMLGTAAGGQLTGVPGLSALALGFTLLTLVSLARWRSQLEPKVH